MGVFGRVSDPGLTRGEEWLSMWINKKIVLLIALLSGCAALSEKRALQHWQQEEIQLNKSTPSALDPGAGLADYLRYAQLHKQHLCFCLVATETRACV